jgi:transposase
MADVYLGVDVHKNYSFFAAIHPDGRIFKFGNRIANTYEAVSNFLNSFGKKHRFSAVLETGRNWGVMYDLLESLPMVESVKVANPFKVKAIAHAQLKTDKVDAVTLAQLLRVNYIPEVYVPPKEIRLQKYLLRQRFYWVRLLIRLKNRIHIILARNHILIPEVTDLFGKQGRAFLEAVELPKTEEIILKQHLQLLSYLEWQIRAIQEPITEDMKDNENIKLLKTIPGIGEVFAPMIALEIGDIERFTDYRKLWSYAGLVPSTYASGGRVYHGRLVKFCNKWLRWAFIEAAHAAIRSSVYFGRNYMRVRNRKGSAAGIIDTARKIAKIVYLVLKEKRAYWESQPSSKFANR